MIIRFKLFESEALEKILKNSLIIYKDASEMVNICRALTDLGFIVFNHDHIVNDKEYDFHSYIPNEDADDYDYDFVRSHSRERGDLNLLTYREFMELINKKIKTIDNPDDPYGEEDWGYTIEERKFKEKELYIRDISDSFIGMSKSDFSVDFKLSKFTNKLRKEIADHYVRFEDSYGDIHEVPVSWVRVRLNIDNKRKEDKIKNVKILFTVPAKLPTRRWASEHELRLPQTIRIFNPPPPKRVYSTIDPYGEEDWSLE